MTIDVMSPLEDAMYYSNLALPFFFLGSVLPINRAVINTSYTRKVQAVAVV